MRTRPEHFGRGPMARLGEVLAANVEAETNMYLRHWENFNIEKQRYIFTRLRSSVLRVIKKSLSSIFLA